jgi:hypothetical protein
VTVNSTSGHAVRLQALACGNSGAGAARNGSALCAAGSSPEADPSTQWFQSFDD